jgi:hypothetical protein
VALPRFLLVFLRRAYRPRNHLKEVFGRRAVAVLCPERNADHDRRAELARSLRGHRGHEPAVDKIARADLYRLKKSGIRAAGPDRFDQRTFPEHHRIAAGQVGGHRGYWNLHILKALRVKHAFDNVRQAVVAGEAETRNGPAGDVPKTDGAARGQNARERSAAGVGRSKNAADAGSGNVRNGNVILLEDLYYAQVSESARESAAECQTDGRLALPKTRRALSRFAHDARSFAPRLASSQWDERIGLTVLAYLFENCTKSCGVIPNSTEILVPYPLCTIARARSQTAFSLVRGGITEGATMDTAYQPWVGQAVVLQVALGDIKVPLRGRLLKDGGETLRMRIGDGWDVDIYKTMVMAVEEDAMALIPA